MKWGKLHYDVMDLVKLAPCAALVNEDGPVIHDTTLGVTHSLNVSAAPLLALVGRPDGALFGELIRHLMETHEVTEVQAAGDAERLLFTLDAVALLDIKRVRVARLAPLLIVDEFLRRLNDPSYRAPARRYSSSASSLVGAILAFARLPLIVWSMLIAVFFVSLGFLQPGSTIAWRLDVTAYLLALPLILLWSIFWHEFGHLVALGARASDHSIIVVRGWKLAIIHREGRDQKLLRIAVSGPIAATVATAALWPLSLIPVEFTNAFLVAPAIAATHLLSLLPISADGKMMVNALKARRVGFVA